VRALNKDVSKIAAAAAAAAAADGDGGGIVMCEMQVLEDSCK